MLEYIAWMELILCWIAWVLAFVKPSRQSAVRNITERAPSSRLGIAFVFIAFLLDWVYIRPVGYHQPEAESIASMILGPFFVVLAWAAAHRLGKQWRYEAALSEDHELIQTGVYGWLRHPIYASMLGMFLSTACCWTWWPLFLAGVVFFLAGTEIRIRAEDRLLAEHFGESFLAWRAHTRAYIPFLR